MSFWNVVQVSELVRRYGREDITVWASVDDSILKKCVQVVLSATTLS